MSNYLIINAYGDLVTTCETYREAIAYLEEFDNEDNRGYRIEIINDEDDDDAQF